MRFVIPVVVAGLIAPAAIAERSASSPSTRTVPCSESIDVTRFPYVGDRRPSLRYRLVLGVVSVPASYLAQVVPTQQRPWSYWRKAGLVIRAGSPLVRVSVTQSWRNRAAITWGNNTGIVESLRIAGCGTPQAIGYAYAGGFYLRSPSSCVPLVFRVGTRAATVRFGVGRRCAR